MSIATDIFASLARNYYNDVIETHNNRRERFPECVIAALARLRPAPYFSVEGFERAPVRVQLVEQ